MFHDRTMKLAHRKAGLTARCEGQRAAIAAAYRRWEEPARLIDRGVAAVRVLRAHPVLVGVAVFVAAILGRRRLFRWVGRGLLTWRAWRGLLGWMRRFSS
jgi:hypothetical protein